MISEVSESFIQIAYLVGLGLAAFFSALSALIGSRAKKVADEVNDAVNHRHTRGPNSPKLYDAVLHLHERTDTIDGKADELIGWKRTYDGGPLDCGDKVADFVAQVEELKKKVNGDDE